jgi:biopolymer transport protein ExbD
MADVAFLLLIFFIATTTIAEEFGISLILPQRSSSQSAQQVNRKNVMVISTDVSGQLFLVDDSPVPLEQIRHMVEERQAVNDKLVVSVEPHRQAPYKALVDILDEVKAGEATRISIKTRRQAGG